MERIPIVANGREGSHLAVRFDPPPAGRKTDREDLRAQPLDTLLARYLTPCLLLQGKQDTSVSWQSVADFAVRCTFQEIELHLFADGDHCLTDRKERLWELMTEFLRGRSLIYETKFDLRLVLWSKVRR